MRIARALLSTTLAAACASALVACGQGPVAPGFAAKARAAAMKARSEEGWEDPVVLDDFEDFDPEAYEDLSPSSSHPFFAPLTFTAVRAAGANSLVMELLGPAQSKPRRGMLLSEAGGQGSFLYKEGEKDVVAEGVRVGFRWGNNGAITPDACTFAQVTFVFDSVRLGGRALSYAWTNRFAPGTIISGRIATDNPDKPIPMRTICLQQGVGLGQPCDEPALNKIKVVDVDRDFDADVRWAFAESTKTVEPGSHTLKDGDPSAAPVAVNPPPQFVTDPTGKPIKNTDLRGIALYGFGADIAPNVCSHAIVDDITLTKKKKI